MDISIEQREIKLTAKMCVNIIMTSFGDEDPVMLDNFLSVIKPYFEKSLGHVKSTRMSNQTNGQE